MEPVELQGEGQGEEDEDQPPYPVPEESIPRIPDRVIEELLKFHGDTR